MSTTIYTITHKKFNPPSDSTYLPLQVGAYNQEYYGYLTDDNGSSISDLNQYYGELTGLYWIWKNSMQSDYLGICHYRRYFINHAGCLLAQDDYETILSSHDIIVSNAAYCDSSYLEYYASAHNQYDLLTVGAVISEKYPEYFSVFEEKIHGQKYYYGNLFVTSKAYFNEYCEWLFDILFEAQTRIDVSSYDLYNQRVFGFLSEQLLFVWIAYKKLNVYECRIGITSEKAETVEFKTAMAHLIKKGLIEEASELFYSYLKLRPDIQLSLSDIKAEIPLIEHILYILQQEKAHHTSSLLEYSDNLNKLIQHIRDLQNILDHFRTGRPAAEDWNYIASTNASWITLLTLSINADYHPEEILSILRNLISYFSEKKDAEAVRELTNYLES